MWDLPSSKTKAKVSRVTFGVVTEKAPWIELRGLSVGVWVAKYFPAGRAKSTGAEGARCVLGNIPHIRNNYGPFRDEVTVLNIIFHEAMRKTYQGELKNDLDLCKDTPSAYLEALQDASVGPL